MLIDAPLLYVLLLAGLLGGIARGYSGFGFAMAALPILSTAVAPQLAVPAVLIHEMVIGIFSLRAERASVSWPVLTVLVSGSLIGTPIGLTLLAVVPADQMKIVVAAIVLLLSLTLLAIGSSSMFGLNRRTLGVAGFTSGLLNGAIAMSGPPAVIIFLGSSLPPQRVRGLLIYFILFSAIIGVILSAFGGFQTMETARMALTMTPGVMIGAVVGVKAFRYLPHKHYRTISLCGLLIVAAGSLLTSLQSQ